MKIGSKLKCIWWIMVCTIFQLLWGYVWIHFISKNSWVKYLEQTIWLFNILSFPCIEFVIAVDMYALFTQLSYEWNEGIIILEGKREVFLCEIVIDSIIRVVLNLHEKFELWTYDFFSVYHELYDIDRNTSISIVLLQKWYKCFDSKQLLFYSYRSTSSQLIVFTLYKII